MPLGTKTDRCWVCGPANPSGLMVTFEPVGVTARFDARFRRQTPIGATVVVRAWTLERRGRLIKAHAEARLDSDGGPVLAEADASMFIGEREEATPSP